MCYLGLILALHMKREDHEGFKFCLRINMALMLCEKWNIWRNGPRIFPNMTNFYQRWLQKSNCMTLSHKLTGYLFSWNQKMLLLHFSRVSFKQNFKYILLMLSFIWTTSLPSLHFVLRACLHGRGTSPTPGKEMLVFTCNPGDMEPGLKCNCIVAKHAHKRRTNACFLRLFRWSCFSLQCCCCMLNFSLIHNNAPINVKLLGGEAGHRRAIWTELRVSVQMPYPRTFVDCQICN